MFCHEDRAAAAQIARAPLERYLRSLVEAAGDWTEGTSSADYPGYDKIIGGLARETFESQVEKGAAWIGTPADIRGQIADYQKLVGGFEIASLQVNFNTLAFEDARRSVELFAREVMPHFAP
jgi:alkanesulfonate monooxygenase SsuD/methylene tetrahydromethanopterin reductase-like flavin-dependent oxidoreductase (luciferase family)